MKRKSEVGYLDIKHMFHAFRVGLPSLNSKFRQRADAAIKGRVVWDGLLSILNICSESWLRIWFFWFWWKKKFTEKGTLLSIGVFSIYGKISLAHCKKGLAVFPSPAGMSLTKLFLGGNNFIIPDPTRESSVSDIPAAWGRGKWPTFFYSAYSPSMFVHCTFVFFKHSMYAKFRRIQRRPPVNKTTLWSP